jgi:hypothetical protein
MAKRPGGVGRCSVFSVMPSALGKIFSDTRAACASAGGVIVLGRTDLVLDTGGRGQAHTKPGRMVALGQEGFVALEVNSKHLLVPKARVDALDEVD